MDKLNKNYTFTLVVTLRKCRLVFPLIQIQHKTRNLDESFLARPVVLEKIQ